MFKLVPATLLLVAMTALSHHAHAQDGEKLTECVDLKTDHEMARFGSQYLLVKDGQDHYRLGFGGNCSAITLSTQVKISTQGQSNRLCPAATRVTTKRDSCDAREVVRVDAAEYERYARKRR